MSTSLECPAAEIEPKHRERELMNRLWQEGSQRGTLMADFVEKQIDEPLSEMRVLEVGVGGGGISCVFAERARTFVGGDNCAETLERVTRQPAYAHLQFPLVQLDMVSLPFDDRAFDLMLMNGVLEYAGCREGSLNPRTHQMTALREANRVLRPGGHLYLGIENRMYPGYLFGDPHTRQPLVDFLPRMLANSYSQWRDGKPYQTWIHSLGTLRRMLRETGFTDIRAFIPLISYQFPRCYLPVDVSFSELRKTLENWNVQQPGDEIGAVTHIGWKGRTWLMATTLLRIQAVFASAFVILAKASTK